VATQSVSQTFVRFGDFELDMRNGELRRGGVLVKLPPQPSKVLMLLVSRAGEVVPRQEIAKQVWDSDTFVDFEQGLNFAIRQIRAVLDDDADHPRYLETLPKRGYRFAAPVSDPARTSPLEPSSPTITTPARRGAPPYALVFIAIAVVISGTAILGRSYFYRSLTKPSGQPHIQSLAVLPLHNLSNDPQQEYFSDGMTDELITDLARISSVKVISHTSVQRYKETKMTLPEIARQLGVDAVVEGSVMRSGDHVRITAQLIDGRSDQHLWAKSYERDLKDILVLQDDVAQQIAREIGINLIEVEKIKQASDNQVDPAAHEAYLKGSLYASRWNCEGFETAVKYFQESVSKDPTFAPAYSAMADSYFNLADWRCWPLDSTFTKAEAAALKATELNPSSAEAHADLGQLAFYHEWNWSKADAEFTRALELDPNAADTYADYAAFLVSVGRQEEGLAKMRRAHELDPVSEATNMDFVYIFYLTHQYDQGLDQARKTLELYPESYATYYWIGQCYEAKGMPKEAVAAYLHAMSGVPEEAARLRAAYQKHGLPGYWEEDSQWRKREHKPLDPVIEAMYFSHTGEKENALEQLDLAYKQHSDGLQFLKVNPVYDGIRDTSQFKQLVSKLKL
jgi:TolB-like protein/DNA-binding winged helix-turn-helix (wHTH) protein